MYYFVVIRVLTPCVSPLMAWGCKFDASPDIWKGVVVDAQQEPSSPRFDLERDRNACTFEGKRVQIN